MRRKIVAIHKKDAFGKGGREDFPRLINRTGKWKKKIARWGKNAPDLDVAGYEYGDFIFDDGKSRTFYAISTIPAK